jgi:hypothetical protein
MKNSPPLFIFILAFSTITFLFFRCTGTPEKGNTNIWYSSDSTVAGENYHFGDTIDSLVQNFYRDKTRMKKKKMEIQKNVKNRISYRYRIEYDSLGRKTIEVYENLRTAKSISRKYDEEGNVLHEKIDFFDEASGSENMLVDYEGKNRISIFLSGLDFYVKQEYDSLGKIQHFAMPYKGDDLKKDSTIVTLFNTEKEKSQFNDTLLLHLKQLESELVFPVKM